MTPKAIDRLHDEMKASYPSDPSKAFELSERVIHESIAIGYERHLADAHCLHADLFWKKDASAEGREASLKEFDVAIDLAKRLGDRSTEGRATHGRGIVEQNVGNYPGAKRYYEQALAIARESGDKVSEGLILYTLVQLLATNLHSSTLKRPTRSKRGRNEKGCHWNCSVGFFSFQEIIIPLWNSWSEH